MTSASYDYECVGPAIQNEAHQGEAYSKPAAKHK
jgi:hypothetical protein